MKNLKGSLNLTCWLSICLLLLPVTGSIAQVLEMSAKDLTGKSTAVLYGKCSKIKSEWNDKKSIIFTYVTVVPEGYIKGNLGSEVILTIPGGQVGNIVYEVSDMPFFTEGEELVAFVWKNPAGKNLITGGSQGKLKIEKDKNTGKRMVLGTGLMDDNELQKQAAGHVMKADRMLLEDYVTKLKGYMKN
jgi:hypothetical protein